jgi:dihydropteroate synthase
MGFLQIGKCVAIFETMKTAKIVGILNLTPDSFSDGGDFLNPEIAARAAEKMILSGAKILDLGAESSAPNAKKISEKVESDRLFPALEKVLKLKKKYNFEISIDTTKSAIAENALQMGANWINDISAFSGDPKMPKIISKFDAKIVLMFSKNAEKMTDFSAKKYENIFATLENFFLEKIKIVKSFGISDEKIILDPGMGAFLSADPSVSFEVLKNLKMLKSKFPKNKILVGTSRKSFLREISDPKNPKNRKIASVVSALWAAENGADFVRVHDAAETFEALETFEKIKNS